MLCVSYRPKQATQLWSVVASLVLPVPSKVCTLFDYMQRPRHSCSIRTQPALAQGKTFMEARARYTVCSLIITDAGRGFRQGFQGSWVSSMCLPLRRKSSKDTAYNIYILRMFQLIIIAHCARHSMRYYVMCWARMKVVVLSAPGRCQLGQTD